jgi:catechol 2,3-dioxygenase-like lactoylglutathione lyase family enzyme
MLKGISHLAFTAKDMEKSLAFYCGGLGLKRAFEMTAADIFKAGGEEVRKSLEAKGEVVTEQLLEDIKKKTIIIYLQIAHGQFLELFYDLQNLKKPYDSSETYGYQHLSLEVDDIQAMKDRLAEKGYSPTSEITLGADNTKQLWYADPDGNKIELMEYTDESWQVTKAVL